MVPPDEQFPISDSDAGDPQRTIYLPPTRVPRYNEVPLGLLEVGLLACLFLIFSTGMTWAALFLSPKIIPALHGLSPQELAHKTVIAVAVQVGAYLLLLAAVVVLMRMRGERFWRGIAWKFPAGTNAVGLFVGGAMLSIAVQAVSSLLPIPKQLPIEEFFRDPAGIWMLAIFGTLVAPFMEELFFRGLLFPALARHVSVWISALFTAFCFALLHGVQLKFSWAPLLILLIVGLALTWVRWRFDSLAASTLVHAGYNFLLFALLFVATRGFTNLEPLNR